MAAKTRQRASTHLSLYVGTGRELLNTELPTLRDLLRYGVLLRETSEKDKRNYSKEELVSDMLAALLAQWLKASHRLKFPVLVHHETIRIKLKDLWEKALKLAKGVGKIQEKQRFSQKLDKLLDILYCKCPIFLCSEFGCEDPDCDQEAHTKCNCKRGEKIPVIELMFIKAQREKVGSYSTHMIAGADRPESRRQEDALLAQQKKKEADERKMKKAEQAAEEKNKMDKEAQNFMNEEENNEVPEGVCETEAQYVDPTKQQKKNTYNTKDISNIALASMRHHTGLRETAEIATAAWIDGGLITKDDTHLVIDHNKVKRAQERLVAELEAEFEKELGEKGVSCLLFDGRKDDTKVMLEMEGSSKRFPGLIKEEHYSVCSEPGGRYLWHFVPEEATEKRKHAEIIADHLVDWLKERNVQDDLQALGGDSTNVNTGWEGGVMQWVEKKLGRRLVWIVCDLHTGELGLRHLIIDLDGPTLSNNRWSGPLGKMLDTATELEINPNFTKITVGPPLIQLSDEVIKDLSTDQFYGYMMSNAIRTGVLPERLAHLEIGPVCHSRWLTTALRFLRIWISKHGLKGKKLQNLRMIVEFIVGVYLPNWFNIKVKHSWVEGPRHVLYQLELLRSQRKKVLDLVMPTIRRSAWYAHPESIIQALLCSDKEEERKAGVDKILEIRGEGDEETQVGDSSVRPRRTPTINVDATSLLELVDWTSDVTEPPLTCKLTTSAVKMFVATPMEVPDWPSHTQSVERCVKMVTEAAGHVYSQERRDGYIRGQVVSRELMSLNKSKQDIENLVKFRTSGGN